MADLVWFAQEASSAALETLLVFHDKELQISQRGKVAAVRFMENTPLAIGPSIPNKPKDDAGAAAGPITQAKNSLSNAWLEKQASTR